jgi:hypothetical protein
MAAKEPNSPSRRASVVTATVACKRGAVGDGTPCQRTVWPACWNDMRRRARSQTMGPRALSHLVPRTTSYPASGITKRSVGNKAPAMRRGAPRITPSQVIRSPLATMAVRRGRCRSGKPERRAASSEMKLCVLPESRSATREMAPSVTAICMVSAMGTPARACREKQGASPSAPTAASSVSSISTPSMKKMCLQNLLWPREYFSSQLKQSSSRRRSACSSGVSRRWLPAPGVGGTPTGGAGRARGRWGAAIAGRGVGVGRRPRVAGREGAGTSLSNSINSTWRARLIAAASVSGLWMRTAWLNGGSKPPVYSWTRWISSSRPARGRRAWKRFEYSSTVPERRHSASSDSGAARRGGPNRKLRRSLNRPQRGVPSSSCSWMYHSCATSSRL